MSEENKYIDIFTPSVIDTCTSATIVKDINGILNAFNTSMTHKDNIMSILRDEQLNYYIHDNIGSNPVTSEKKQLMEMLLKRYRDVCYTSLSTRNKLCCWNKVEPYFKLVIQMQTATSITTAALKSAYHGVRAAAHKC